MFKKLKDKIAEEVKQSPLKSVQQLAQAVVSPSSSSVFEPSSSNDKFCIEEGDVEEDETQEQEKPGGFTSVALTGQTASPVRDQSQKYTYRSSPGSLTVEADNLFPKFEPQPTNYHVQSDWESASEVEDRYSQLEHITKESLYEAYRKVYNRYNKMRNRYHEVVTHYRQLEREKEKAKTVLTETQDKALLRISELRDQCLLEQQAKAHLEEALRNELEERDHIIKTLRTKVQYLKGVSDSTGTECLDASYSSKEEANLIDFTENSSVSLVPLPLDASSSADKINWFEEKLKLIKATLIEETEQFDLLKSKLKKLKLQGGASEDESFDNVDNSQLSKFQQNEVEVTKALGHLIGKISAEVQSLQKSAISCSLLTSSYDKQNFDLKSTNKKLTENRTAQDEQKVEMEKLTALIKQLEEQNKTLSHKLEDESSSLKEVKNELNCLKTTSNMLKSKIKLSNDNYGKNDAINCLISNVENELIQEWNLCFQNFLQTRCEVTVLKDTKEDLEKELLRLKEEGKQLENTNKEITEKNNKFKGDMKSLQNKLEEYLTKLDTLSMEKSELKASNENLEMQIKKIEKTLLHYQNVSGEKSEKLQKIIDEKSREETKLISLEEELAKCKTECGLLLESKEIMNNEIVSLRKENIDVISEKEALNNKVNEMENKLKLIKDDYKLMQDTSDGLENQINSLTNLNKELAAEKNTILLKLSNLESDLEKNKASNSSLLEEKNNLMHELEHWKSEFENISKEKLTVTEKLDHLVKELESNKSNSESVELLRERLNEVESLKKENDKLLEEKRVLENNIKSLNLETDRLKSSCSEYINTKNDLSGELFSVKQERDKLVSEINLHANQILELESALNAKIEELSILMKEHAELTLKTHDLQKELTKLQESQKLNLENHSSISEVNKKLSDELSSLGKERESLLNEKYTLENEFKTLNNKYLTSVEELTKLTKEQTQLDEKFQSLQNKYEKLLKNKKNEEDSMKEIKSQLREKEEMLRSVSEINQQQSKDIEMLKENCTKNENELKLLKDRHNTIVAELEKNKELVLSLKEIKIKLSEEISCLKNDCERYEESLKKTKAQLQQEETSSLELKNQICSISESFKEKCQETNEKYQENIRLKSEMDKLMDKVNALNTCIEKLTKEKNVILNYLLVNFNNVKIIKELQKGLCDFVNDFQDEMSREINYINYKLENDLLKLVNHSIEHEIECSHAKLIEVEHKSKDDINSYNSKLKNFQELSNIQEEVLQVNVKGLESVYPVNNEQETGSNMVSFRQMGHLERLSQLDIGNSYEPEVYLKQAILLMKSFTNLLNHNSVNSEYSVDLFTSNNDKSKLDSEGKNIQKEIVAMESFITNFETKYHETSSSKLKFLETDRSDNKLCNEMEMQLRQEISLKDDIIKKLQSVIEDYEQKEHVNDIEFIYKQKLQRLEQENDLLNEKLQKLQDTHELNVKNVVSEYEKKIKEVEDESSLYDFEKIGKEQKHIVNEMKEQIQNLQQDLEERGDAFEKLYEEHQQTVKSLDGEIHQLRSNHDKELREQDKKWRQCLDRRLAEEETRHQQALNTLNMEWNSERRELETARRLAVNAVESGSGSNELLRRQVQALTMQLAELRNQRCEACGRKRKSEVGEDQRSRSVQDCTEMEYLRNILYEYMMGKEPLVLAKVLCALVKFDENQTKEIVSKEEHRITLFGQLGLL
ncbi:putative leucine-rich repeat-containing protein DDB_G0290503 isoform X1 [Macrosteles quadrilineatus]|uniref:putative leucine-rich repeat-containing protein DDB_G0290503 isoform X1 n=1 Tax=Macrosteles quadrilineatus TaxID=74068 RepID=UPI0023E15B3E|nr:putative leucine-rich repeat-containing protein DDB_G0290503 isoform X1 [Macrosteles quadrilineatus]